MARGLPQTVARRFAANDPAAATSVTIAPSAMPAQTPHSPSQANSDARCQTANAIPPSTSRPNPMADTVVATVPKARYTVPKKAPTNSYSSDATNRAANVTR